MINDEDFTVILYKKKYKFCFPFIIALKASYVDSMTLIIRERSYIWAMYTPI
jgi:2-oxo-4-hydroxy-4-carboxy--5-ureidoimidazoline (OHCU) decarboxylase